MRLASIGVDQAAPRSASAGSGGGPRIAPVALLQVALFLSLTANLVRIPVLSGSDRTLPLLVNDLGVGLALTGAMLVCLRERSLRLDSVAIAALLFAAVGGASAFFVGRSYGLSAFELVASISYLVRWLFYFGVYLVVINFARNGGMLAVWHALETMLLIFVAFGVVQSLFLPGFAQMIYPDARIHYDWDPQGHRLVSTALEPNIAAAMIATGLLVEFALISSGARVAAWKTGLLFVGLVLTLSRSGLAALVTGGLVILAVRGLNRRLLRWTVGLALLVLASLPVLLPFAAGYSKLGITDASAASRWITLGRAIDTFLEHPWFGIGFNTFGFVQEARGFERTGGSSYSSEGGLLFVAVMTGVVGLAIFMTMLWLMIRRSRRVWRDPFATPTERGLAVGAVAATAGVLVHSTFVNSLFATFVMQPLWILWGLTFVAAAQLRARRSTATVT